MNPLNIPGPLFLALYAALTVALSWMTFRKIAAREEESQTRLLKVREPYAIAYLRGGVDQLTQVVVLALIRRGLLMHDKTTFRARSDIAWESTRVESAGLAACRTRIRGNALRQEPAVRDGAE